MAPGAGPRSLRVSVRAADAWSGGVQQSHVCSGLAEAKAALWLYVEPALLFGSPKLGAPVQLEAGPLGAPARRSGEVVGNPEAGEYRSATRIRTPVRGRRACSGARVCTTGQ